jgi:parvulin-like peptidyl-prolyl isomerase
MRRTPALALSLAAAMAALAACKPAQTAKKATLAKGKGISITSDDFKARLDEQSIYLRSRYTTLDRKKEFLEGLVRFELLSREAEREGLARDPEVQSQLKRIMVQKLVQKRFQDPAAAAKEVPEPELQKYYDEHKEQYYRAPRVRLALIAWNASPESPDRAKKLATAKKALAKLQVEEKKNTLAFAKAVTDYSEDPTKGAAGDLNFKARDELEKAYGKELADAAFALKDGETSGVIQGEKGIYLVKATGHQEEVNRTFEQVKPQIQATLLRERRSKDFDEWLKKLRADAGVSVDEKALEALDVAAGAPTPPGMGGHGMGMGTGMGMGMGMGGGAAAGPRVIQAQPNPARPQPAPAMAPARPPAAAPETK